MNYRISIALLLLAAAGPALAHGQLPTPTACSGQQAFHLGAFGYAETGLREYRICLRREANNPQLRGSGGSGQPPVCRVNSISIPMVTCPAKTCGEFDDDYRVARALALATCTAYANASTEFPDGGLVVPIFDGPASFLDADHHQVYELSDGISGVCALCPDEAQ